MQFSIGAAVFLVFVSHLAAQHPSSQGLLGAWKVVKLERQDDLLTPIMKSAIAEGIEIQFTKAELVVKKKNEEMLRFKYILHAEKEPSQIDVIEGKTTYKGIFKIKDNRFFLCFSGRADGPRPKDFTTGSKMDFQTILVMKREK
jgi:uncharacterized protein (TIGR03067 family)